MKFCPKCGTSLIPDDRFCQDCGFDTYTVNSEPPREEEPVTIPVKVPEMVNAVTIDEHAEEPAPSSEPVESILTEPAVEPPPQLEPAGTDDEPEVEAEPAMISAPEPEPQPEPVPQPVSQENGSAEPEKTEPEVVLTSGVLTSDRPAARSHRKKWFLYGVLLLAAFALGAGGWFGYHYYQAEQQLPAPPPVLHSNPGKTPPVLSGQQKSITEISSASAETPQTDKAGKPLQAEPKKKTSQATRQPSVSEHKPTAAQKNDQAVTPQEQTSATVNDDKATVILRVGQRENSKLKNPKKPVKLIIRQSTRITRIITDHYNDGTGAKSGGTITIFHESGKLVGHYPAQAQPGPDGIPNTKWVARPNTTLAPDTYTIWDSDLSTWSKTLSGIGFIIVEGYEVQ